MGYLKFLFIFLFAEALLFSCSKNSLDLPPLGQLDATAVTNKQGVDALLIGAYSLLDGVGSPNANPYDPGQSAGSNWLYGSVTGSEAHRGSDESDRNELFSIEKFTTTAYDEFLLGRWGALYDGAQRCNDVLRTMRKVSALTPEDTVEFRAEALFLRAHYHFEAKKMWNNIPFVDENITYEAGNYKMSNEADIWPFIEEDLRYAVDNLPNSQGEQIGRANHYSAEALLAKAYLFQHKFDSAKILLDEIITSGKYKLKKYAENFNASTKNNEESVFAAQSSVNDGAQANNANIGDQLNQPSGGLTLCCSFFQPSQYLVNHFKTDTAGLPDLYDINQADVNNDMGLSSGDPFDPYPGTLDPRLDWTVGRRGIPYLDWGVHPGKDWIRTQSFSGPYSAKKTSIYASQVGQYTDASYWTVGANAININLIRYADVLLWAAEAEVMSANGSLVKAQDYVNQLRNRAADSSGWVYKYKDDKNPAAGYSDVKAANYYIKPYPGVWTDPAFAMKAIRYERMLELGMEGHRFFDLVRWGVADHDINAYFQKEKNITDYLNGVVFNPAQDSYFPIPQSEIDKSDHRLKQNPGY